MADGVQSLQWKLINTNEIKYHTIKTRNSGNSGKAHAKLSPLHRAVRGLLHSIITSVVQAVGSLLWSIITPVVQVLGSPQ